MGFLDKFFSKDTAASRPSTEKIQDNPKSKEFFEELKLNIINILDDKEIESSPAKFDEIEREAIIDSISKSANPVTKIQALNQLHLMEIRLRYSEDIKRLREKNIIRVDENVVRQEVNEYRHHDTAKEENNLHT